MTAAPAAMALSVALLVGGAGSAAEALPDGGFSLPIGCALGRDCWIMNYPDTDPGPGARDPWCGPRAYDGHEGIDVAVRDMAAMRAGVPVLAAADGVVRGGRDGMEDRLFDESGRAALAGRDCGNGVAVDHGGGWETQYCHMRRGSVAVKPGDRVRRGDRLGLVGLSGRTQFPHIHLTVRRDDVKVDPSTGRTLADGCGADRGTATLWRGPPAAAYSPGALYAAGFAPGPVQAAAIKSDAASPATLRGDVPALVLWAAAFGVRAGDRLDFEILAPDGAVLLRREHRIDRDQAWRMEFTGIKRTAASWPAGNYRGRTTLRRDGRDGLNETRAVDLSIR